jgi:hypothetical protein
MIDAVYEVHPIRFVGSPYYLNHLTMFKNPMPSFFCQLASFLNLISNQTGLFQSLGHLKKTVVFINSCASSGSNGNLSVDYSSCLSLNEKSSSFQRTWYRR